MKFMINGREYNDYQLSNNQIAELIDSDKVTKEEKSFLMEKVYARFKYELCARYDENNDNVFVRFFSNFVNGQMMSSKKVAELMCNEHRYLQNEMFKVCLAFIKKLAENYDKDYYDPRNKYAAKTSSEIINFLENNS